MRILIAVALLAATPAASYAATDWYVLNPNTSQCKQATLMPSYMRTPEAARMGMAQVFHVAPAVEIARDPDTQRVEIVSIKNPNDGGTMTFVAGKAKCEEVLKLLEDSNVIAKPGEL